ncbi:MAG: ATP synthase subunit I [Clostridia bacterium]|nr:ATP synthase subunit I [Clostridia bacterium]
MENLRPQESIVRETKRIAIGSGICLVLMMIVYALIGRFSVSVLLGGIIGTAYAIFNFFQLGMTIQKATSFSEQDMAARQMKSSYSLRMAGLLLVCVVCFVVPFLDGIPCMISMLFPRITILVLQMTGQIHD